MQLAPRTEKSVLGGWWMTIDRWVLGAVAVLVLIGLVLVSAASPAVAERLNLGPFHFVYRHIVFLGPAMALMLGVSMLSRKNVWRLASLCFVIFAFLTGATLVLGDEVKGATRWIYVMGFSLQPSEFLKPAFAVTAAWLLARRQHKPDFPGMRAATLLFVIGAVLLIMQPDFGMTFVLGMIWAAQIFLAGLPMVLVLLLIGLGVGAVVGAYSFLPHVASRIDRFLDPTSGDNYQVQKSLEAFSSGGFLGTGPGHGQVKLFLPDAHSDFIFAVAGEEFGLIATLLIVSLFCFIIVRSVIRTMGSDDLFVILGVGGLLTQFAMQALVHMGSALQLLPAKGMTLPFISYGGSSLLAMGLGMGMLLCLTRRRPQASGAVTWRSGYGG